MVTASAHRETRLANGRKWSSASMATWPPTTMAGASWIRCVVIRTKAGASKWDVGPTRWSFEIATVGQEYRTSHVLPCLG